MKIEKKDVLILVSLIILILLGTYLWTNHHLKVQRAWYWAQYPFIKSSIRCSDHAPAFMYELMLVTVKEQKSMSNQLAYLSPNGQVHHCESGWEDGFKGEKVLDEHSRFSYASITKMLTSAMILELVAEDKIRLNQPILEILPVPEPKDKRIEQITVAMLLQHSAGFDRTKTFTPMLTMGKKPWCPTQLNELANVQLDFDPNTEFKYSNVGYCLLGAIIEQVTQLPYRVAVEEKYHLASYNMKFLDNEFLPDEIQYDYRNEDFYTDFWRNKFDFKDSLSAVGGLSGSAKQLVMLTRSILDQQGDVILTRSSTPCAIDIMQGCYGYVMDPYQASGQDFTLFNRSGHFPGVETDLFIDDHGGILVSLRGSSVLDHQNLKNYRKLIYEHLINFYQVKR